MQPDASTASGPGSRSPRSKKTTLGQPWWCCCRYKAFIGRVTPEEWFEGLRAARDAKKQAMKDAWRADCNAVAQKKLDAAAAKQKAEHDMQWARTQQQFEKAEKAYRESLLALRETVTMQASCSQPVLCWLCQNRGVSCGPWRWGLEIGRGCQPYSAAFVG